MILRINRVYSRIQLFTSAATTSNQLVSVMEALCVFNVVTTGKLSPTAKRPQCEANHSPIPSVDVMNKGATPPLAQFGLHGVTSRRLLQPKHNLIHSREEGMNRKVSASCFWVTGLLQSQRRHAYSWQSVSDLNKSAMIDILPQWLLCFCSEA